MIGRYPDYTRLAAQKGWNALDVPDWAYRFAQKLPGGFWQWINRPFIEAAVLRGDRFLISNPTSSAAGSTFELELEYLFQKGYNPAVTGEAGEQLVIVTKPTVP